MTYLLVRLCHYAIIVTLLSGTVATLCGLSLLSRGWKPTLGFHKPMVGLFPQPSPRRNNEGMPVDEHGKPIDGTWLEQPIPLVQPKPDDLKRGC